MFAVRMAGDWKAFAAAGEISMWTIMSSSWITLSVIVAGILSVFLRIHSVNRPTVMTPSSVGVSDTVFQPAVPWVIGGSSLGTSPMTVVPAPGWVRPADVGATGLREQPVRRIATVVIRTALRRELLRTLCLAGGGVLGDGGPEEPGPSTFTQGKRDAVLVYAPSLTLHEPLRLRAPHPGPSCVR